MKPVTPFPPSSPPSDPEGDADDDPSSISGARPVVETVAIRTTDDAWRVQLASRLRAAGLVPVGADRLSGAALVISEAPVGSRRAMADVRGLARSDAAIILVLDSSAPESEVREAYEGGALLCIRKPVDESHLLGTIRAAINLHSARAHADDLMRQLDVHTHLASLGRVTANFTHELANPLTVLGANFGIIKEHACGRASQGDFEVAIAEIDATLDRINDLLQTVRKLARGSLSSRIEDDVDVAQVVRDACRWAEDELQGIELQELVDEPVVARADARLLGQVVLNLLTNAAHAARNLPSPRIRVHVYGSPSTAIVSVRDNGPGIPDAIRDRIFEPFFTTRRERGGTGLGLALCREYATQMQGQLTLWTAPGRGACFRIRLRRTG